MKAESKKILVTTEYSVIAVRITGRGRAAPLCSKCGGNLTADSTDTDNSNQDDGRLVAVGSNRNNTSTGSQNFEEMK